MISSSSEVSNGNAETLVAASHPKGLLRGIAARRAFTAIVPLQAAARRFIARRRYPSIAAIVPVIWTRIASPRSSTSTITPRKASLAPPSGSRIPVLASPTVLQPSTLVKPKVEPRHEPKDHAESTALQVTVPVPPITVVPVVTALAPTPDAPLHKFDGPEHNLVHLTILLGTSKKECVTLDRQIRAIASQVAQHQSRVQAQEAHIASLEASMDKNFVTTSALEKLEAELVEASRDLDGSMAKEAAGKGLLLQLKSKARAQARLHAQWHQKRNAMAGVSPVEAEQMMRDTVARAKIFADAASAIAARDYGDDAHKYKNISTFPGVRDMASETRVRLIRRRSPLAPLPKPKLAPSSTTPSKIPRRNSAHPPPSSALAEDGVKVVGGPTPISTKRQSLSISAAVSTQARNAVNARLEAFYSPVKSSSKPAPVANGQPDVTAKPKPSMSTPPSSFGLSTPLFDEIALPSNLFKTTETTLDLDLKLPSTSSPITPASAPASPMKSLIPKISSIPLRASPSPSPPVVPARSPMRSAGLAPPRSSISKRSRYSMPAFPSSAAVSSEVETPRPQPSLPPVRTPSPTLRVFKASSPPPRRVNFARTRAGPLSSDDADGIETLPSLNSSTSIPGRSFARSSLPTAPLMPLDPNVEAQLPSWASELLAPLQRPRLTAHKHTPSGTESVRSIGEVLKLDLQLQLPTTVEEKPPARASFAEVKGKSRASLAIEKPEPASRPSGLDLNASRSTKVPAPLPSAFSDTTTGSSPTKSEWDVMSTTEFETRASFHLADREKGAGSGSGSGNDNGNGTVAQSILNVDPYAHLSPDRKAKLRKRSSFGLPLPSASFGGGGTAEMETTQTEGTGAKWKRRLSNGIAGLPLPHFRQNHGQSPTSPSMPPSSFGVSLSAASPPSTPVRKKRSSLLSLSNLYH